MKIGLYGGTFNPIHRGHTEAAGAAAEYLGLDKLFLIPAGIPPHKHLPHDVASPEERLEMTALAAENMGLGRKAEVLDMEILRKGKSYTVNTLEELRARYPEDQFYLLMGTDMFMTFHQWHRAEDIAGYCTLCAFSRNEDDRREEFLAQSRRLKEAFGAETVIVPLPEVREISSTQVREALHRGEGQKYLHPAVYGYILRKSLYGVQKDLKHLPLDEFRCAALSLLNGRRVAHVLGTEETAAKLALRWGADEETARRTALLHDCTKKLTREQHLAICRLYGVEPDEIEMSEEKLLHAPTGAAVAREVFGLCPEAVSAIRWHTTGKADMTLLEKIMYLADYIEPNRNFCDLTELRRLAMEDLDEALLLGFTMAVKDLREKGMPVHPNSVLARDYLKGNH